MNHLVVDGMYYFVVTTIKYATIIAKGLKKVFIPVNMDVIKLEHLVVNVVIVVVITQNIIFMIM
jgi:hypothetical protein